MHTTMISVLKLLILCMFPVVWGEWHQLEDSFFLLDNETLLTFDDARARCQQLGADLARIDTEEINAFLTQFITPPLDQTRCFWFGLTDMQEEDEFRWLDGSLLRDDWWSPGQPDDFGLGQDCACLWSSTMSIRHGLWDDNLCNARTNFICQKSLYYFILASVKKNPGYANISCAVTHTNGEKPPSPEDIKVAVGESLSSSRTYSFTTTVIVNRTRENTFIIDSIDAKDKVFCYVGDNVPEKGSLLLAKFSTIRFYELPVFISAPTLDQIGSSFLSIIWSRWNTCFDSGEGPVVGYRIYIRTGDGNWSEAGLVEPMGVSNRIFEFNVTDLDPDTEYNVSVSVIREGLDGEGPPGPAVMGRTLASFGSPKEDGSRSGNLYLWAVLGLSVLANVILALAVLLTCVKMKRQDLSRLQARSPAMQKSQLNHEYHDPTQADQPVDDHTYESLHKSGSEKREHHYLDIISSGEYEVPTI